MSAAFEPSLAAAAVDVRGVLPSGIDGDRIGAATTLAALVGSPEVRRRWPVVAAAARVTANHGVRSLATVGGTVAARLPGADLPAALAAHGATVRIHRADAAGGPLTLPLVEYLGAGMTAPHLVSSVCLGMSGPGAYRRFVPRPGPAAALATVAGVRGPTGVVGLWAGACGPTPAPVPCPPGGPPGPEALRDDDRASAGYRAQLVAALAAEVLDELAS
jgi:CO/xanthine dehydrogenase FAD-binding subunit